MGLKFQASLSGPWVHPISSEGGRAVGAITAHIGDTIGCGEPDIPSRVRGPSVHRFQDSKGQGKPSAHVVVELSQANDFLAQLTQDEFAKCLGLTPTNPDS